jgi:signal transduction histidine kinase
MKIDIAVKKSLIYILLLLGLLVPCYLLFIWAQKAAFGTLNYAFSLVSLVLFVAVGFLFAKFRYKTEEALDRVLFKKRYDHRETLLRFSRDMVSIVDLETLSDNLLLTVGQALGIEKASLFLSDEIKGSLSLRASIGLDKDRVKESPLLQEDPLLQKLMITSGPLVREEVKMARDGPEGQWIAERMDRLEAEVSLPLVSKDRLIGILNMGHKQGNEMYSHEDLEVLSTLANQAAVAIENARLYDNLKQSQNIIRRADRLSSLGMLTAGLAHEIRNPLVAIRTFTQLLPERYGDVEFRNNFQAVALKEVDRICGLINDLLSFARPSTPNVSAEDVNQIVESTARILETEAKENDVRIHLQLDPGIPNILIDKEQIKQVLMNFVLNAIQAIEDGGVVELSTRLSAKDGSQQFVQIGVRDSGVGIAVKDLENIFNPFFTTKKEGSGLGLSISHQIVQEHGGSVVVDSKLDEGSTFLINLPVSRPLKY